MLMIPPAVKIYLCTQQADMRRGFDGLSAMVQGVLRKDPFSGHLFVFRNRRGDRVKILFWDRTGYALFYKRLEQGRFHFPAGEGSGVEVDVSQLMLLLEGIDLAGARHHKRYSRRA